MSRPEAPGASGRSLRSRVGRGLLVLAATGAAVLSGIGSPAAHAATPTGSLPDAGSPTAAPRAAEPVSITLQLADVQPTTLTPNSTLRVTATIHNTGTGTLHGAFLHLGWQTEALDSRDAVVAWSAATPQYQCCVWPNPKAIKDLAAGRTTTLQIAVPAKNLRLPGDAKSFGPRGLAVRVTRGKAEGSGVLAEQRTFTVWSPTPVAERTEVSLVVPVTRAAPPSGGTADAALQAALGPDGSLQHLINATAGDPAVAWAIDPELLAEADAIAQNGSGGSGSGGADSGGTGSAGTGSGGSGSAGNGSTGNGAGSTPTANAGTTGTTAAGTGTAGTGTACVGRAADTGTGARTDAGRAASWLAQLCTGLRDRVGLSLPYGDPDLAALAHAGKDARTGHDIGGTLLAWARAAGASTTAAVLGQALPNWLAWPAEGRADQATINLLAGNSQTSVIVANHGLQPSPPAPVPPAVTRLAVQGSATTGGDGRAVIGSLSGLIYDIQLSGDLRATGNAERAASSRQLLLADLAAITASAPVAARQLLLVAPRGWDPNPAAVRAALKDLHQANWITLAPLNRLHDQRPSGTVRRVGYSGLARAAELPTGQVNAAYTETDRAYQFTGVVGRDNVVVAKAQGVPLTTGGLWRSGQSLLGVSWRGHQSQLSAAQARLHGQVQTLYSGLAVKPGVSKLVLSRNTGIPVSVTNSLSVPVTVQVVMSPRSGRLQVTDRPKVTLSPSTGQIVTVKTRSLANGDVLVDVSLANPAGASLVTAPPLDLRLHGDWENRALLVAGLLLGILVAVGLFRGVRRGRRRERVHPSSVPDPDDIGYEDLQPTPDGRWVTPAMGSQVLFDRFERPGAGAGPADPGSGVPGAGVPGAGVPGAGVPGSRASRDPAPADGSAPTRGSASTSDAGLTGGADPTSGSGSTRGGSSGSVPGWPESDGWVRREAGATPVSPTFPRAGAAELPGPGDPRGVTSVPSEQAGWSGWTDWPTREVR